MNLCSMNDPIKKVKTQEQTKEIFANHMSQKDLCLEHIKASQNSKVRKSTICIETRPKIQINVSLRRMYSGQVST